MRWLEILACAVALTLLVAGVFVLARYHYARCMSAGNTALYCWLKAAH